MISKSKLWDRQGMQGGTAVCPFHRSNVSPTALVVVGWLETSSLQCSFPLPTIKQSWLPTTATWLHEGCNSTCQNADPGENVSALHKSFARPTSQQLRASLNTLHEPHLSEVVRVRFKIHISRNICGFANCLWTSYTCSTQDKTFQNGAGAKWDIYWERVELKGRDAFEIENAFVPTAAGSSLLPSHAFHPPAPLVQPHLNSTQFPAQVTTDWSVQTMNCLQIVIIWQSNQKKDRDRDHVETSQRV